jgi:hypothetical protein
MQMGYFNSLVVSNDCNKEAKSYLAGRVKGERLNTCPPGAVKEHCEVTPITKHAKRKSKIKGKSFPCDLHINV